MGGLIVREALNKYGGESSENTVSLFITIATPFGGHPAAATGEKHGLIVLPSWRDVNPVSSFIMNLYRKPLPESVSHQLLYAYQNRSVLKLNENSDGVVPLSSQLYPMAQKQAHGQFGFNTSHTGILKNEEMITYIIKLLDTVENFHPEEHLRYLFAGGYDVDLGDDYSQLGKFFIRNYGKSAMALTKGIISPFYPEQEDFLRVIRGEIPPDNEVEEDWLKFKREFPEIDQ